MDKQRPNSLYALWLCLVVGSIGAVGQALMLHNTLVHSYPYKLMDTPPSHFYGKIGQVGLIISPLMAIAAALCFRRARTYIIPAIPALVCPLAYWLTFELGFLIGPYNGEAVTTRNFDGYTGETARYQFAFEVLTLLVWGLVIGLVLGAVLSWFTRFVFPWTVRLLR